MRTREELIVPLVRGKRVLDLGNSWGDFKDLLAANCAEYRGLDIGPGTDYRHDLNTPMRLGRRFDVIVAGELIEHIENVGVFLENVRTHLKPGGLLFLTTPNPTSFRFFAYALFGKEPAFGGHVTYFTRDALVLLLRRHFPHVTIGYTNNTTNIERKTLAWKLKFRLENGIGNAVPRLSPHLYAICRSR